jgi:hypothetical protein
VVSVCVSTPSTKNSTKLTDSPGVTCHATLPFRLAPSCMVEVMVNGAEALATTPLAADDTVVELAEFDAVTAILKVLPTSASASNA